MSADRFRGRIAGVGTTSGVRIVVGRWDTSPYGATDERAIIAARGSWQGVDLGALTSVAPDPRFGFGSTPRRPSVTSVVTTVVTPVAP